MNAGLDHDGIINGVGYSKGFSQFHSQTAVYSYLKGKEGNYTVKTELGLRFSTWQFHVFVGATFVVAVVGGQLVLLASTATMGMGGLATASSAVVAVRTIVDFISNINNDECED